MMDLPPRRPGDEAPPELELSVVMPCLDEAETLGTCVEKAMRAMRQAGIHGEVIVADNGSTDGSQAIAIGLGARVVPVPARGYGSALMGGIAAARGRYVLMGDADDSYDFLELPRFVEKLREGYALVQGCRLEAGGGRVLPGAMPFLHRWWGNPMFSLLARLMFLAPVHDVYCGMRAFTRDHYERLEQRCTGMEFAVEMIVKSSIHAADRIAEVPITLHPDGRKAHAPHLKTFRDGWRTLRFLLLYSPRWLFLYPGAIMMLAGLVLSGLLLTGPKTIGGVTFEVHTLLYAALAVIIGFQAVTFSVFTKLFAIGERLLPEDPRLNRLFAVITMEKGLIAGAVLLLGGLAGSLYAVQGWASTGFGPLDRATTLRLVIPSAVAMVLGIQVTLASFFMSVLGLRRR
jgi:glycosyltransferase involved in cell wall biosynthesis